MAPYHDALSPSLDGYDRGDAGNSISRLERTVPSVQRVRACLRRQRPLSFSRSAGDSSALMGTRSACGLEQCGFFTAMVLIWTGNRRNPCGRRSRRAGNPVLTIEGLGLAEHPHPLHQAFLDSSRHALLPLPASPISAKLCFEPAIRPDSGPRDCALALNGNILPLAPFATTHHARGCESVGRHMRGSAQSLKPRPVLPCAL